MPGPWWESLQSEELNTLIEISLEDNFSVQQAWARVKQSQAMATKTRADTYPQLDGSAGFANTRGQNDQGQETTSDDFTLGLSAAYEIDLWGRVQAEIAGSRAQADAAREDLNAAAFSLSGQVAESWVNLLDAKQQKAQLEEQLELNRKLLELVEMRFSTSKASALDVYQQQQTVKAIEGGLITIQATQDITLHQLAVLSGHPPTTDLHLVQSIFPGISAVPPTGLPTDLLYRRPDILAAEHRLHEATWEIAVARAERLPQFRLTGAFSYNSGLLETLLDTWVLRLAANLSGPIFDGGSGKAEVQRTRAVAEERLAAYRQTVLTAILEVENSLVREQQYRATRENIRQQIDLTKKAYREATYRYLNGLSDFLPVLREQLNLITNQLDFIRAGSNLLTARIGLCKALGGDWPLTLEPPQDFPLTKTQQDSP